MPAVTPLDKVRDRLAKIETEKQALLDTAERENRLTLSDEEETQFAALEAEQKKLAAQEQRLQANAGVEPAGRRTYASSPDDSPIATLNSNQTHTITVNEPNFTKDPMKGFKSPREFFSLVMQNSNRPAKEARDERLRFLATVGSDEQSTFSDSYGGFFVPVGMSPGVLQIDAEGDPFGGRVTNVPMATTRVEFNARVDKSHSTSVSGGLTVSRRAEAGTITDSRMQWEKVTLQAYSLFGMYYATEELLTDSPVSIAAIIAQGFQDQFTYHIVDERINGKGLGEFLGIMQCPALISVTKETGQAAATIVYENVLKMYARLWGKANAFWLANHNTLPQLASLNKTVGTGGALVWMPSANAGVPNTLLGLPVYFTEYCATLGTTGDIILVNGSQYLEGVYQPMQSAESVHVRFVNHERVFKFWLRNAGAPWWKSALTPKNGDTLSPFVALATRS